MIFHLTYTNRAWGQDGDNFMLLFIVLSYIHKLLNPYDAGQGKFGIKVPSADAQR